MKTVTCLLKLVLGGRITIPQEIRKYLELEDGDLVKVVIEKAN